MSEGELHILVQQIDRRFDEIRADMGSTLGVVRDDISALRQMAEARPCSAHASRLDELDSWRRGFWVRVIVAVAGVVAATAGLIALLRPLLVAKGGSA